jgi:hypothetical protein
LQAKKDKAVRFLRDVLEDNDKADEVEDEDVEGYAARKHIAITNPPRRMSMANGNANDMSKADLQDYIDQATQILQDVYQPESSREDLAAAIEPGRS